MELACDQFLFSRSTRVPYQNEKSIKPRIVHANLEAISLHISMAHKLTNEVAKAKNIGKPKPPANH